MSISLSLPLIVLRRVLEFWRVFLNPSEDALDFRDNCEANKFACNLPWIKPSTKHGSSSNLPEPRIGFRKIDAILIMRLSWLKVF